MPQSGAYLRSQRRSGQPWWTCGRRTPNLDTAQT